MRKGLIYGVALALLAACLPMAGVPAMAADTALRVISLTPAAVPSVVENPYWADAGATLLGNGQLGAAVFGGVADETVLLNEATLWSGGPGAVIPHKEGNQGVPAANQLQYNLLRQKIQDAAARGETLPWDAQQAAAQLYRRDAAAMGTYQELGLLRLSEQPLIGLAARIRNLQSNAGAEGLGDQHIGRLFDGTTSTKWCYPKVPTAADPIWFTWEYGGGVTVTSYRLTTAEDMPARDPRSWRLYGSSTGADGSWQVVDERTNITLPDTRRQATVYTVASPAVYRYYRLELYAIKGTDGMCQMCEFLPLGEFNQSAGGTPDDNYTDYRRELDLESGVATVRYTRGGVTYTREYFVSRAENVMAVRITADRPGAVSLHAGLDVRHRYSDMTVSGDTISVTGRPEDQRADGLRFMGQVKVLHDGGTLTPGSVSVSVQGADSVTLLVGLGTTFAGGTQEDVTARMSGAAAKGYAALRTAHVADVAAQMSKITPDFGGTADLGADTAQLLAAYPTGNTATDRWLEALCLQYGRYLTLAAGGGQNLWSWGMKGGGAPDAAALLEVNRTAQRLGLGAGREALLAATERYAVTGATAAHGYAAREDGVAVRGWTGYQAGNLWGYTAPAGESSPTVGALLAADIWDAYTFDGDKAALSARFSTLLGAAQYWVDALWTDDADGKLAVNPSWDGDAWTLGGDADQRAVAALFDGVKQAAQVLGRSGEVAVQEVAAAAGKLRVPPAAQAQKLTPEDVVSPFALTFAGGTAAMVALAEWYGVGAQQLGDVNADGKIDSTDARMVLQYEVKLIPLTAEQRAAGDVSKDSKLDSSDARMILQYEVELLSW